MEQWKDIPGYEGRYQASTLGRIRSIDHPVKCAHNGVRMIRGRVLSPGRYCKSGHLSVVLGHGSNGVPVHQLVARTFLGPQPIGTEVLHEDGNPRNNTPENLRYGTRAENILDVFRQGKAWRKLRVEDVSEIKRRLGNGEKGSSIAASYGVSQSTISAIKKGKTFQWLTTF